jgi:type IV pilus assembly protein PilY1
VVKYDINGDGIVSGSDKVLLFFGTGRGGSRYYAIDVTSKTRPLYMWSIGPTELPSVGQTWSPPTVARVNVSGETQNSQKLVLIVGGGYDTAQDGAIYTTSDSVGNRLYMIDAMRGTLLWSAGPSGSNLVLPAMTHSIPSAVSVLDTNTDGYADRMYVGDMAGQLWRFDITNGNTANSLVAGGVIASLGHKESATAADARRFYSPPDVAALQRPGQPPIFGISIGSGYRGHPLNTATQDRFYSVRDFHPFTPKSQTDYDSFTVTEIVKDADLVDVTSDLTVVVPAGAAGWQLKLNRPDWQGEKSLTPSNTFGNKVFFTTYTPPTSSNADTNTCTASSTGTNRAYIVNAFNGAPIPVIDGVIDPDASTTDPSDPELNLTPDDRFDELAQGGIAPEISFLFPGPDEVADPDDVPGKDKIVCLSGVEVLSVCKNFKSRIKTYWSDSNAF